MPYCSDTCRWSRRKGKPMLKLNASLRGLYRTSPWLNKVCSYRTAARHLALTTKCSMGISSRWRRTDSCPTCEVFDTTLKSLKVVLREHESTIKGFLPSYFDNAAPLDDDLLNPSQLLDHSKYVIEHEESFSADRVPLTSAAKSSLKGAEDALVDELEKENGLRQTLFEYGLHFQLRDVCATELQNAMERPESNTLYLLSDFKEPPAAV